MEVVKTKIEDLCLIKPSYFGDKRGYFSETFNLKEFEEKVRPISFVQDNESMSSYGVLRGLHYQLPPFAQSKLVRVIQGKVLDVAVDIRKDSKAFGEYVAVELSDENHLQFFIPRGFAHGFVVLSETAVFSYKVDNYYAPESEASIRFDDPFLNIDWKLNFDQLLLSDKDQSGDLFKEAKIFNSNTDLYE